MDRIELLEQYFRAQPQDPFNLYALTLEYQKNGDSTRTLLGFRQLLAEFPDYLATYFHAAAFYAELGLASEAEETYQRGIALAEQQADQKSLQELNAAYNTFLFEQED